MVDCNYLIMKEAGGTYQKGTLAALLSLNQVRPIMLI